MNFSQKYYTIIKVIISYYGFEDIDEISTFRERENKYLLLLLTKKYNCYNEDKIKETINIKSKR